jgi:hypothetical protein
MKQLDPSVQKCHGSVRNTVYNDGFCNGSETAKPYKLEHEKKHLTFITFHHLSRAVVKHDHFLFMQTPFRDVRAIAKSTVMYQQHWMSVTLEFLEQLLCCKNEPKISRGRPRAAGFVLMNC